jgi:hypothetical protein
MFTTSFGVEWGRLRPSRNRLLSALFLLDGLCVHRFLRARGLSYREFKHRFAAELSSVDAGAHFSAPVDGRSQFSKTGPAPYIQRSQTPVQKPIVDLEFDEISFLVGTIFRLSQFCSRFGAIDTPPPLWKDPATK